MIGWTRPERPTVLALVLLNRLVVDAGDAAPHKPAFVELPVLVAVGAKPVPGAGAPAQVQRWVGEAEYSVHQSLFKCLPDRNADVDQEKAASDLWRREAAAPGRPLTRPSMNGRFSTRSRRAAVLCAARGAYRRCC